ncbi:S-layer homology domain-containing protein [Orenia marismortui]|uniref:S-layer family protein n=1 Tax=Orenia marismortui TaxID=46469 RepID=A0A4R8HFV0_9FIRM|nr:S-layer homology domain-containing protein [Orenia marismortui]TDX59026.1 S-layer family protein [Orenia marismortui]
MKKRIITSLLTLTIIMSLALPVMAYRPEDIATNHWALEYISPLLDEGIMYVYKDGKFHPNQATTRGEFAYSLAKAMNLETSTNSELTDISNHPSKGYISALVERGIITGYPDKTFRPEKKITRAEIITMLGRSLSLNDEQKTIELEGNFYFDINENHWANNLISLATRLNIINGYPDGNFKPNNYVTRAESAKLLAKLKGLKKVEGQIIEAYPLTRKVKVKVGDEIKNFKLSSNTLIGRNNRLVNLDAMLVSDEAYLLLNESNNVTYLKAFGLITKEDVGNKVSDLTNNILSAEELVSIADGDWEAVTPRLKQEVTMTLLEEGLTISEVQAMFNQDWNQLELAAKDRLIEAISINTNLPVELIEAASNKDWETAKEVAKNTAITTALKEIMSRSDLLS